MKTEISETREIKICYACGGEGYLIQMPYLKRMDCPRCNGTGRIFVIRSHGEIEIAPYEEILPIYVSK